MSRWGLILERPSDLIPIWSFRHSRASPTASTKAVTKNEPPPMEDGLSGFAATRMIPNQLRTILTRLNWTHETEKKRPSSVLTIAQAWFFFQSSITEIPLACSSRCSARSRTAFKTSSGAGLIAKRSIAKATSRVAARMAGETWSTGMEPKECLLGISRALGLTFFAKTKLTQRFHSAPEWRQAGTKHAN